MSAILSRRSEAAGTATHRGWVFPGRSRRRPYHWAHGWYQWISEHAGTPFWFHACRNCFITVANRDLMLGDALVKRLVNHAPSRDVTVGYAAEWTLAQLRDHSQRIANRIEALAFVGSTHARSTRGASSHEGVP